MQTKTILFLSPLPPPYYGSAISSQTCLDIIQNSDSYKVVHVKLNYSESFDDLGKFSLTKLWGFIIVLQKVISAVINDKPSLIYIMPATEGFAFARDFTISLFAKLLHRNIIYHLRTRINQRDRRNIIKNFIFKLAFKNAKAIVLGKELVKEILPYFKEKNIFILPNAIKKTITDKEYQGIVAERRLEPQLRLLFLSNMMKSKGWPKVLEVAKRLEQLKVNFTITFAGSWPSDKEKKEFYDFVNQNCISGKLNYIGHVNNDQKKDLLKKSDVLLFPTEYKYETFGRVNIEAMEFGIPVVANAIGTIPSIVNHGSTGFLLNRNSVEEILSYLIILQNREELIRIGENARTKFLDEYEFTILQRNFLSIIQKVSKY